MNAASGNAYILGMQNNFSRKSMVTLGNKSSVNMRIVNIEL